MAQLVEPLATDLAHVDVRTGVTVAAVHADAHGVRVHDDTGNVHAGSHAVVTVPLGVLKSDCIAFEPPLPNHHRSAIDRVGFGVFEKVIVRAGRDRWSRHGQLLLLGHELAPYNAWTGLTETAGAPVVVSINGGASGRAVLTDTGDVRGRRAIARLGAVVALDSPTALATDWTSDPYSRGAYSFLTPTSSRADFATLSRPVHGRILFAGEATSADRHGYVDGAFDSGLREARRLLDATAVTLTLPA
jgi:polyamine oxidase